MKFNGMLEAALPDAEIAAEIFLSKVSTHKEAVADLKKLLAEFARAGANYMAESFQDRVGTMDGPRKPRSSGPAPCGEIPLTEQGVCNLATGTLEVPHSSCQHCGEVVNATGVDRFGYKHPEVHEKFSSFGWSSEYMPINPSPLSPKPIQFTAAEQNALLEVIHSRNSKENPGGEELRSAHDKLKAADTTANFQAEDRLHRIPVRKVIGLYPEANLDEASLMKTLRNKEQVLESRKITIADYLKAHPCKGFKPVPMYSSEGDFLTLYFEDALCHTTLLPGTEIVEVERAMDDNRIVGVKLYGVSKLGLLSLTDEEHDYLVRRMNYDLDSTSRDPALNTIINGLLVKLTKMETLRGKHQEGENRR